MATPITWQNVTAPQAADISRPLYFAQNAITSGLGAFGDALKQYEAGQRDIWKRQDADATQSVLDRIYQAGSVEEFNRLNASGAFNETTGPNGARIDRAAVNALRDPRLGLLQNRELERARYNDSLRQQADAPMLADSLAALSNGDFTGAFRNMERLSPQGRALLASNIDKARKDDADRGRVSTEATDRLVTNELTRRRTQQQMEESAAQEARTAALAPVVQRERTAAVGAAETNQALSVLRLNEAKLDAAEKDEVRRLDGQLAKLQGLYLQGITGMGKQQGELAQRLGLPVDGQGIPRFASMNPDQIKAFDTAAKAANIPLSQAYMSGDTAQGNAVYDALVNSGSYSPSVLKKSRDNILGAFDRTILNKDTGVDALSAAVSRAEATVANETNERGNFFAPGGKEATAALDTMQKETKIILDGMPGGWSGINANEDVPYMQKAILDVVSNGIDIGNGKRMVPPVNVMLSFVKTVDGSWTSDETRANNFKTKLAEWMRQPENLEAAKKGLKSQTFRDEARIRQLTQESLQGGPRK
jgi:hypothetical protein